MPTPLGHCVPIVHPEASLVFPGFAPLFFLVLQGFHAQETSRSRATTESGSQTFSCHLLEYLLFHSTAPCETPEAIHVGNHNIIASLSPTLHF